MDAWRRWLVTQQICAVRGFLNRAYMAVSAREQDLLLPLCPRLVFKLQGIDSKGSLFIGCQSAASPAWDTY